jgi:hypothetical protein
VTLDRRVVASLCSLLMTLSILGSFSIAPTKATSDTWYAIWHSYQERSQNPVNLSSTTILYSSGNNYWVKIVLVTSVYQYSTLVTDNAVTFRTAVYVDSFASSSIPVPLPYPAEDVSIVIEKDDQSSNRNNQWGDTQTSATNAYHQGYGLDQTNQLSCVYDEKFDKAAKALEFAVGLVCEPIGVAWALIDWAYGYTPEFNKDYHPLLRDNNQGSFCWYAHGYDFGSANPTRQYCFDVFTWKQDFSVNPTTYYGIKIYASVKLRSPNPINQSEILTLPVYLRIDHYGGDGCPYISTWSDGSWHLDNNVLPAAEYSCGTDVVDYYTLQQPLSRILNMYFLKLNEFENEHS